MVTYIQGLLHAPISKDVDFRVVRFDYLGKHRFGGLARMVLNVLNLLLLSFNFMYRTIEWRPDIVHIQTNSGLGLFEKYWIALLGKSMKRKVLLHVHGGNLRDFYYKSPGVSRRIIRSGASLCDRIVTASPFMKETWELIGVSTDRIALISNAVPIPEASNAHSSGGETTILFLTRIVPAKGILELIDAVRELRRAGKSVRLRIVGAEERETQQVKDYLAEAGAGDFVEYVGPVPEAEKQVEYWGADIFAFPTHVEDQSYAVMEAMSYGLPCVASDVGGVPSLIRSGEHGLLVPAKDVDALAAALERLVDNKALAKELGAAARKRIESEFTWAQCGTRMLGLYEDVLTFAERLNDAPRAAAH